jgi:hypothetical protein
VCRFATTLCRRQRALPRRIRLEMREPPASRRPQRRIRIAHDHVDVIDSITADARMPAFDALIVSDASQSLARRSGAVSRRASSDGEAHSGVRDAELMTPLGARRLKRDRHNRTVETRRELALVRPGVLPRGPFGRCFGGDRFQAAAHVVGGRCVA